MKSRPSFSHLAILVPSCHLAFTALISACPLCKETVGEQSAAVGDGFSASVLVMLGTVFTLGGAAVVLMARAARETDRTAGRKTGDLIAAGTQAAPGPSPAPLSRGR